MEFFIDTADIEAIRELCAYLPIDGVTTNPTIITKSGKEPQQVFDELCEVLTEAQKIIAQVVATDYEGILAEAQKIAAIRRVREKLNLPIAIMLDTKGPEYRIKTFGCGKVVLKENAPFTLRVDDVVGDETQVSVNYEGLSEDLQPGDRIHDWPWRYGRGNPL